MPQMAWVFVPVRVWQIVQVLVQALGLVQRMVQALRLRSLAETRPQVVWDDLPLLRLKALGLKPPLALLWEPVACLSELKKEKEPWPAVGSQQQVGLEGGQRR